MISEAEAAVLDIYFSKIPPHGNLGYYSVSTEDMREDVKKANITEDSENWIRFFVSEGNNQISLDIDLFLRELIQSFHDVDEWLVQPPDYEPDSEDRYIINLDFSQRGTVNLYLYTDAESISSSDPSILEKSICIWTIEPSGSIIEDDAVFSWRELLKDNFLSELGTQLKRKFGADSHKICSLNSPALNKVPDEVEDSVLFYSRIFDNNAKKKPNETKLAKISNYIDENKIRDYIKSDEGWIIVCSCSVRENTLHLHYFKDDQPSTTSECESIKDISNRVRNKVKTYNNNREGKKDIQPAAKTIGVVLATAGAIELLPLAAMTSVFDISTESNTFLTALLILVAGYVLIGVSLLVYMLIPAIKFRMHSWKKRSPKEYLLDIARGTDR